jgi:hypothetical protein
MNERVLLVNRNGIISEFYLESSQDKDFVTIAERPRVVEMGKTEEVKEPLPIKKKMFKFHHFGPTYAPVYYEVRE